MCPHFTEGEGRVAKPRARGSAGKDSHGYRNWESSHKLLSHIQDPRKGPILHVVVHLPLFVLSSSIMHFTTDGPNDSSQFMDRVNCDISSLWNILMQPEDLLFSKGILTAHVLKVPDSIKIAISAQTRQGVLR